MRAAFLLLAACTSKPVAPSPQPAAGSAGSAVSVVPDAAAATPIAKLDLPAIPTFDVPPNDGTHTPRELRLLGKPSLLDKELLVTGVVTWIYDCATAIRKPDQRDEDVQKSIEKDPTQCEIAKFHLGDSEETPDEQSLWIVEAPRPFRKLELRVLSKSEIANPPPNRCDGSDPKKHLCPDFHVGDRVSVVGTFAAFSPHNETTSNGVFVYRGMSVERSKWSSPGFAPPPPITRVITDRDRPETTAKELTKQILANPKDVTAFIALVELYRRWDDPQRAIAVAMQAQQTVPDAESAELYFALASAMDDRHDIEHAIEWFTRVLALKPDHARARFSRGRLYRQKGDKVHARQDIEAALKAPGDGDWKREANQILLDL